MKKSALPWLINYLCTCDFYGPVHSDSDAGEYSMRGGGPWNSRHLWPLWHTVAVTENVACICTCSICPRRSSAAFSMSFDKCVYRDAPKKISSQLDHAFLIGSWFFGGGAFWKWPGSLAWQLEQSPNVQNVLTFEPEELQLIFFVL